MKKKFYEEAEMEIVEFEVEDVITASNDEPIDIPTEANGDADLPELD